MADKNKTAPPAANASLAPATAKGIMEVIQSTPVDKIAELEFVKNKYVNNYNACNPNGDGELMYHRNLVFIKQAIAGFKDKQGNIIAVDPFSVYACITNMAVYGLSAAPMDDELYLYPMEGKMYMQRQAGAYIKRLQQTGQILSVLKVDLVYEGDEFIVEDDFVKKHSKKYASDKIIAGYVKFQLSNGNERHFDYRPSDWESWRSHSPQPNGGNWRYTPPGSDATYKAYQPKPGFLKTKIISHACTEKSWTPGRTPATVEIYSTVIRDRDDEENETAGNGFTATQVPVNNIPAQFTPTEEVREDESSFANGNNKQNSKTINHSDEDF